MNGCDYCVPNEDGITLKLVNGRIRFDWQRIMIWIKGGNIRFKMYQDFADNPTAELEFPVNYCPMCGRKLKEVE